MALKIKRGLTADLPSTAADGEILFATDTNKLYVGNNGSPQEVTGGGGGGTTSAFLLNQDGSKSVQVNLSTRREWAGQSLWSNSVRWNGTDISMWGTYANMLQIQEITNQEFASVIQSLAAGDTLTLYEADTRTPYVFTIVSSIYDSRDGIGYPGVSFVVEETNTFSASSSAVYFGQIDGINAITSTVAVTVPATFHDSGLSTLNLVADTALIGNVSVIDNTISAVDEYGAAGELVVDGDLTITGALNATTTLVVNADGSKSVVVGSVNTTQYSSVSWMDASLAGSMDGLAVAGKVMFSNVSQETRDILNSLVPGDKVTLGNYNGMVVQYYTFTVETAGLVFDYMYMRDALNIVETNPSSMSINFNSSYGLTVESGKFVNYDFSNEGLSVTNVVADTALIGNVSVIDNTISAVDEYGAAGELVVDGDLTITGALNATTTLVVNADGSKSVVVGGIATSTITNVNWMQATWPGTMSAPTQVGKLVIYSPSQSVISALNVLAPGDTVTLGSGDFGAQYTTLTVQTAGFAYDPMYGSYALNVVELNPSMMSTNFQSGLGLVIVSGSFSYFDFSDEAFIAPSVISESALLGDVAITGNTISAVDASGYGTGADLSIVSNLVLEGDLTVSGQLGTPANTSNPAAYTLVQHKDVNGIISSYYMPLYQ